MINPSAPFDHNPWPAPDSLLLDDGTDVDAVDRALVHRAATSADYLTGLITAGTLHRVAHPNRLPTLLFPDTDPDQVQDIWNTALAVGYTAGLARRSGRWDTTDLDAARAALAAAGFTGMATAVEGAAYAAPSRKPPVPAPVLAPVLTHPADTTSARTRP